MIRGRGVTVAIRTVSGRNSVGEAVYSETSQSVDNVLIVPGATADLDDTRPEGTTVALTLHWPKNAAITRLKDALITLEGEYEGTYHVIGDPKPYQSELCPTQWCMPVEVEVADGC